MKFMKLLSLSFLAYWIITYFGDGVLKLARAALPSVLSLVFIGMTYYIIFALCQRAYLRIKG